MAYHIPVVICQISLAGLGVVVLVWWAGISLTGGNWPWGGCPRSIYPEHNRNNKFPLIYHYYWSCNNNCHDSTIIDQWYLCSCQYLNKGQMQTRRNKWRRTLCTMQQDNSYICKPLRVSGYNVCRESYHIMIHMYHNNR